VVSCGAVFECACSGRVVCNGAAYETEAFGWVGGVEPPRCLNFFLYILQYSSALDGNDCPVCRKDGRFAYGIKFLHGKDEVAEGDSSSCCACAVACYGETAVLPWCVFQKLLDLCNGFRKKHAWGVTAFQVTCVFKKSAYGFRVGFTDHSVLSLVALGLLGCCLFGLAQEGVP